MKPTIFAVQLDQMKDYGDSVLDYDNLQMIQLAVRKGYQVLIGRDNWNLLDDENRAALILHEAIYSLARLESTMFRWQLPDSTESHELAMESQLGYGARRVVGTLFTQNFVDNLTRIRLFNLLAQSKFYLPVRTDFLRGANLYVSNLSGHMYGLFTNPPPNASRYLYYGISQKTAKQPLKIDFGYYILEDVLVPSGFGGDAHARGAYEPDQIVPGTYEIYSADWMSETSEYRMTTILAQPISER
jgi:hypothetical protein